jgi:DNA invertase Pin-like site-specific DNA recombinase
MAKSSLMSCTWTETMRMLEPIAYVLLMLGHRSVLIPPSLRGRSAMGCCPDTSMKREHTRWVSTFLPDECRKTSLSSRVERQSDALTGKRAAPSQRDQLKAALDYLREGDVLVSTKLDRLARSMRHLIEIVDAVKGKGASLRVLGMHLDTETATGRMMLQVLGAVAEHERAAMLERQREGIARAKAEGKYRGRAKTAMAKAGEVERLLAAGVSPTEVARKFGIGRSSVYRAMRERKIKRVASIAPSS